MRILTEYPLNAVEVGPKQFLKLIVYDDYTHNRARIATAIIWARRINRSYVDTMFSTHYNSYDIKYTYQSTAFCVPMGATINQKSVHVLEIKIGDRTRTTE